MKYSLNCTEFANEKYLSDNLKYMDIAILPLEGSDNIESIMKRYHNMGVKIILVTMGKKGAYAYDGDLYFQPAIVGYKMVDSLGTGDSFIACFLAEYLRDNSIDEAMALVAKSAFETCLDYGAFSHGMTIPD